jgi:hypothetical protein
MAKTYLKPISTKPVDPKVAAERERKKREVLSLKVKHDREKESLKKKYEKDKSVKEASTKADKLFIMHSAKVIGKVKDDEERERQVTDLERKAKKMGFKRDWIERTLSKQGAYKDYDESFDSKKKEAEIMNSYLNVLSLDRSVNLWAEVAKSKDEDLEPVKGSKTLTKKTQEKVTINPMERDTLRSRR